MLWNKLKKINNIKYIYIMFFFVFLFSGFISFYWIISEPQTKPKIPTLKEPIKETVFQINKDTKVIFQKKYSICQKYDLSCDVHKLDVSFSERAKLNGLRMDELRQAYPPETWQINKKNDNQIILTRLVNGLCPAHKKIWHLGLNSSGDYVAVYYGPSEVKNEGGIYKVTDIPLEHLSLEYQMKIKNYQLEFYQVEELIATLDSFSEFLD